ncbi:MAG: zinc-binding dehydrogenase [Aldersonia sp.]|nr:zinc-binding dehydrogenase [Aldersonia sp.]
MDAVVVREFGPAENMHLESVADPSPGPGAVRVAVESAGVHVVDTRIRTGRPIGPFPVPELPYIPGREVVGAVDSVGASGDQHLLGRRVAVSLGNANGGYATLAVAPAAHLHVIDPTLDAATAATMVGTGRTAVGLLHLAAVTADDTVLITAAAGGIGTLVVQRLHDVGAHVVALAGGPEKTELVRKLGADLAVDYRDPGWDAQVRSAGLRPTVLLDGVGGAPGRRAVALLAPGARLLSYGNVAGDLGLSDADLVDRRVMTVSALGPGGGFTPANIFRWADEALESATRGQLRASVTRFPLAEAATAHARLEDRSTTGKVVLDVD